MNYVVTGANRGIGLGFVEALLRRGDTVYATSRDPQNANALNALIPSSEGRLHVLPLDVANADQCKAFGAYFADKTVDVLISNAGILDHESVLGSIDYDEMRRGFETNTLGPLRVLEALLPSMRKGQKKLVVNISTQMASIADNGMGGYYAYRASKAALNMVTRSAALDLKHEDFVVFALHPGWVQTDMGGEAASLTVEQSVSAMMGIIDTSDASRSGTFWSWKGHTLPW
jgi:NAD(P)-dependent dehydrogenase (short-subunit alcohol dehydrogenase family)